jgi:hypothetical protein
MKRSFLTTLVALAVAIPAAALASGGEGTRIALKPANAFPAAKGSAKFKAKPGERRREARNCEGERPRRGAAQPQQRARPAGPAGEGGDRREGSHRRRQDRSLGLVLAGNTPAGRALSRPARSLHCRNPFTGEGLVKPVESHLKSASAVDSFRCREGFLQDRCDGLGARRFSRCDRSRIGAGRGAARRLRQAGQGGDPEDPGLSSGLQAAPDRHLPEARDLALARQGGAGQGPDRVHSRRPARTTAAR